MTVIRHVYIYWSGLYNFPKGINYVSIEIYHPDVGVLIMRSNRFVYYVV